MGDPRHDEEELARLWEQLVQLGPAPVDSARFLLRLLDTSPSVVGVLHGLGADAHRPASASVAAAEAGKTHGATDAVWDALLTSQDLPPLASPELTALLAMASPWADRNDSSPSAARELLASVEIEWKDLVLAVLHASSGAVHLDGGWDSWAGTELAWRPCGTPEQQRNAAIARAYLEADGDAVAWLQAALLDERKWLVVQLAEATRWLATPLTDPMIDAGVLEPNPSRNRSFLEVATHAAGAEHVLHRLAQYLEQLDTNEAAGAARALYWMRGAVWRHIRPEELARVFLGTERADVRRSLVDWIVHPRLPDVDDDAAEVVQRAIAAAHADEDPFIQHRIRLADGSDEPFDPLPPLGAR